MEVVCGEVGFVVDDVEFDFVFVEFVGDVVGCCFDYCVVFGGDEFEFGC